MNHLVSRGAKIVADDWLQLDPKESLLIVTSEKHRKEAEEIRHYANIRQAEVDMMVFEDQEGQVGHYFDQHEKS